MWYTVGCYVHYITETLTRTHPGVTLSHFVFEFTSERPLIDGVFLLQSQKLRVWLIYWISTFFTKTVHSGSEQVMTSFPPPPVQEAGIQLSSFLAGWDHNLLFLEKLHLDIKSVRVCCIQARMLFDLQHHVSTISWYSGVLLRCSWLFFISITTSHYALLPFKCLL